MATGNELRPTLSWPTLDGMSSDETTFESTRPKRLGPAGEVELHPALVLVWSRSEPHRLGEAVLLPRTARGGTVVIGRAAAKAGSARRSGLLVRQRPGGNTVTGPLDDPAVSRAQLELSVRGKQVTATNVGRATLLVNGEEIEGTKGLRPGDLLTIGERAVFLLTRRPAEFPASHGGPPGEDHAFGQSDAQGIVGESPLVWRLRQELEFAARREEHVLLLGPSGTGKELAAQALHSQSPRSGRALVSRNAASIPEGLVAAELFGNVRGYPNPGTPEREGLVGAANGGTLLLDEIGELPEKAQANLLRVLDDKGEYQRLGEAKVRHSKLRLVAATNRPETCLKPDLAARFSLRITLPSLANRAEDIPLIARHLLHVIVEEDAEIRRQVFGDTPPRRTDLPMSAELLESLVTHEHALNVRELHSLLWTAISSSPPGDELQLTREVARALAAGKSSSDWPIPKTTLTPQDVAEALSAALGNREEAAHALGLSSRYALYRVMKKLGME